MLSREGLGLERQVGEGQRRMVRCRMGLRLPLEAALFQGRRCGMWKDALRSQSPMDLVEIMVFLPANSRCNGQMPPSCPVGTGPHCRLDGGIVQRSLDY